MRTKRFDFNFRPLQINRSISVVGSVPGRQNYDADSGEYTPDYTITPLVIQPTISRLDKDDILIAGSINSKLTNIKWYEILGGVSTLIASTNASYEITTSGDQAGRIKVKKNVKPSTPLTLQFYAEYLDTRTNQLHVLQDTYLVRCDNATAYIPALYLDAADQTIYNPLNDPATQTVHASLKLGTEECPAGKRIFVWEVFRPADAAWSAVGADEVLDYDVTVSADGTSCTVNRELMGGELYLRCRAKYDIGGNPASVTLNDASPCKVVAFTRRIPKYEYDFTGVPVNIPAGLLAVSPEAVIMDTNGEIANPTRELLPLWYIATNKASGTLSYSLVAHGLNPTIATKLLSTLYGAVIGLDVQDIGPIGVWEDGDGALFEDGDGNLILIH